MIAFVFDTETSDLVANRTLRLDKQLNVIEFYGALVDLTYGQVMDDFETLIKPSKPLTDEKKGKRKRTISEITGITNEMLTDAPAFDKVADAIRRCVERAPLVISHNLSFDKDALEIEFARLGQTLTWPPGICTVEASVHCKGYRMSLPELHQFLFNEEVTDHHRAKVDTEHLINCCVELQRRDML